MSRVPAAGPSHIPSKQVQFLENKVNKLRWVNDDLNKKVFEAAQRGHRLAAKLGYSTLEEAELALATQAPDAGQSQLEQLSQYPVEELAEHVQTLQSELINHVQLSKSTLSALEEALQEMMALREENLALRGEVEKLSAERAQGSSSQVESLREELAALRQQYADLHRAKEKNDEKHADDFRRWRRFRDWIFNEMEHEVGHSAKRRKLSPKESEDEKENGDRLSPDRLPESELEKKFGRIRKRLLELGPRLGLATPERTASPAPRTTRKRPAALASRNLNSPPEDAMPSTPIPVASTSKVPAETSTHTQKRLKRKASVEIPQDEVHASSETEPESQPPTFLLPSQIDVTKPALPVIPQKRPRSPVREDSSETEVESQAPTFLFPSQIIPETSSRAADMTPKPRPVAGRFAQLRTPISVPRPQQGGKGKDKARGSSEETTHSDNSSSSVDPFRPAPAGPAAPTMRARLPDTPISLGPKKGKGRLAEDEKNDANDENDENAPPSTSEGRKYPDDYSAFKGRGRYKHEVQAGKETINALYELDAARNDGVGFQYEEVVRDKQRRKHMHAGDCECCRDYYEAIGPLPPRPQAPLWRSPESTPSKPPRADSFAGAEDGMNAAAIEEHKQAISRHRQHWPRAKTPPGYWNIGFPDTQEVAAMNAEAARMHAQKRAVVAGEAERGGRFKKR